MTDKLDKEKRAQRDKWRKDPISFFTEALDVDPKNVWDMMQIMCEIIRDSRKTAVKAGHSVSKTYTMARIVLWYLYCWSPSTVITTAPTHTQVEEILWREIREAHTNAKIKLGGQLTKTKLDLQGTKKNAALRWFAIGFSTRPDQGLEHATKMQGYHNKYVLIVLDEADGILPAIWRAIDALLTSEGAKMVAIGNPLRPTGEFADCFKDSSFEKLTISVEDTPNYKEGREVIPGLSGREYVADMEKKWGRDSDMFKSRVLGQIPDKDPEAIVPSSWYEKAEGRQPFPMGHKKRFLTVDVADGGNDDTVIKGWENKSQISEKRLPGKRADEIDGDVLRELKLIDGTAIIYDHDGCGRILGGLLRGMVDRKVQIIPFEGSLPYGDEDFFNWRAYGHHRMHCDFKDNHISVFPHNAKQKEDITSVRWGDPVKGKIIVEKKEKLKKRLSRSPDDGDAVMMMCACYDQVTPKEIDDMYLPKKSTRRDRSCLMSAR